MEKSFRQILPRIIRLKIKEITPSNATKEEKDEYCKKVALEVNHDYSNTPIDQFNRKYKKYLAKIHKNKEGVYKKTKKG